MEVVVAGDIMAVAGDIMVVAGVMAVAGAMDGVGDTVEAIIERAGVMAGEVRAGGMDIVGVGRVGAMAGVDPSLITATMPGKKQ